MKQIMFKWPSNECHYREGQCVDAFGMYQWNFHELVYAVHGLPKPICVIRSPQDAINPWKNVSGSSTRNDHTNVLLDQWRSARLPRCLLSKDTIVEKKSVDTSFAHLLSFNDPPLTKRAHFVSVSNHRRFTQSFTLHDPINRVCVLEKLTVHYSIASEGTWKRVSRNQ